MLFGSLFIFVGAIALSWNYLVRMRDEVYSDMKIAMTEEVSNVSKDEVRVSSDNLDKNENDNNNYVVDYSKYLGVLEIPRIGLKRGFYNVDSKYNSIEYNVTMVKGSTLPDQVNGNLILIAHSGDAYISYFAYLWRLGIGDRVYVTYNGVKYEYQLVNIYNTPKDGAVTIHRNMERTTLTMITCTKNDDSSQTIYIAELVG